MTKKTDARGVQTDYFYDALNRVTNCNYSTPNPAPANYQPTPNVVYTYDDVNIPNSKGKLTKVTKGTGTDRLTTEYTAFDILGRVRFFWRSVGNKKKLKFLDVPKRTATPKTKNGKETLCVKIICSGSF